MNDVSHFVKVIESLTSSSSSFDSKNPSEDDDYLQHLHFGILGLSGLILSVPYQLPNWMPRAILILAHHVNDPEPIRSTIQKTINEFRRTHQDTWHKDKHQFNPDDLHMVSDLLISPSYYA